MKVDPQFIMVEENGTKRGPASEKGRTRKKLRDISIWKMLEHNSVPHKTEEIFEFFASVRHDLREAHTELALHTESIEFKTVARTFGLQQIYGPKILDSFISESGELDLEL